MVDDVSDRSTHQGHLRNTGRAGRLIGAGLGARTAGGPRRPARHVGLLEELRPCNLTSVRSRRRGWKDRVLTEGDELLVLAEDQRIRDAEVRLRSTHPEHRDFAPLAELLVGAEAASLRERFDEV